MNFDGMVDVTRFFAPDGTAVVREEHDFDFDGRLDQISYYEAGAVVRTELDTNFDNVIDTWLWCSRTGMLERSERDRRHNGRADTWEQFDEGVITEARYDENNDGNPDRWEVFTTGVLTQVRRDSNADGEADQSEDVPAETAGSAEPALSCDGVERAVSTSGGSEPPPPAAPLTEPTAAPTSDAAPTGDATSDTTGSTSP